MEKETRPRYAWLAAAAAALMVLVFVAGLMLGRGSKPPAPTVAPGTVATSDDAVPGGEPEQRADRHSCSRPRAIPASFSQTTWSSSPKLERSHS